MSGVPSRFAKTDQTIWQSQSTKIIDKIVDLLDSKTNYQAIHEIAADWRQKTAQLNDPRNYRVSEYGRLREEVEHDSVSEQVCACWPEIAEALYARAERLIEATGYEGYTVCQRLDSGFTTIEIFAPDIADDEAEKSVLSKIEYWRIHKDLHLTYPDHTKDEDAKNMLRADLYLKDCLAPLTKGELLLRVGGLTHFMAHSLGTYLGNASITQWFATAIFKFHGYEVKHLIRDAFPKTEDGLSFDWNALITPSREIYARDFVRIMHPTLLRSTEYSPKVVQKPTKKTEPSSTYL